ncbi:MAG: hypothetical protein ACYC61_15600 [Isosphaeraceae bacterium]
MRHGYLLVHGWALALAGIDHIAVMVNGQRRARLTLGGDRPDVAAALPQFGGSVKCGFSGRVALDRLEPGEHSLVIQFLARDGARLEQVRPFRIPDRTRPDSNGADSEYLH